MQTDWLEDMISSRFGGIEIGRMRSIARVIRLAWRYGFEGKQNSADHTEHYVHEVLRACGCLHEDAKAWAKDFIKELNEDASLNKE